MSSKFDQHRWEAARCSSRVDLLVAIPRQGAPTHFNVDLKCDITDAAGRPVESAKVIGQGDAEFDEFKADFALSGKRAAEDALLKMQRKLLEMKLTPKSMQLSESAPVK